ncbi:MAG: BamA/TamA family outer membrane protein [Alphaproteobacteria bacterium]
MTGSLKRFAVFLLFFTVMCAAHSAQAISRFTPVSSIPYKTYIFGITNDDLRAAILSQSDLVKGEKNPPETVEFLKNRAQEDLGNLQRALAAEGYYDAELDYFVDARTTPSMVYVKVNLGTLYTIGAFKIKSDPVATNLVEILGADISKVGITLGQPAKRTSVQEATLNTVTYLQKHGYPFAKLKADRVVVDRSTKQMQVALLVQPGGMARFGNTILQENGGVTGEFIKARLLWKKGEIYNEQKVLDTIQRLYNTKLFKEVKVTHDDRIDAGGFINLYLKLVASDRNIVRPIASYIPGLSFEPGVSWEKRNFANQGDILTTSVQMGVDRKQGHVSYVVPDFQLLNLNLSNDLDIHSDTFKPFTMTGGDFQSVLDYPFSETIVGDGGVSIESNNVTVNDSRKTYRYLKVLLGATFTNIEDEMAPRQGVRVRLDYIPYIRILNRMAVFEQIELKPEFYVPLSIDTNLVLHGWAHIGASPGAGKHVIPAHKLFYNDGPGTVRGYRFQMAGILNGNIPTGGRSALSFGAETEYYFTELFSVLGFIDFGTTYVRQFPDFKNALLYGVGGGARYRTPWGTIRFDVASPMKRRTQDYAVEIYAGLDKPL